MITINARGARTLADTHPLRHNGRGVYVLISENEATLFFGGDVAAVRAPGEVATIKAAQDWAYEVIESEAASVAEAVPGVAVADYAEAVHGPTAAQVRENAATALTEAERQDARATVVESRKTGCTDERNPRHPKNQAARIRTHANHLRKTAEVLAAWSAQDEMGYQDYVSQGLGATDGYFAPIARTAWKATLGA